MAYNLVTNVESCYAYIKDAPFGLIYYSHIPTGIAALAIGLFVFYSNRKFLLNKLLFLFSLTFFFWSFADLVTWTYSYNSVYTMFAWSLLGVTNVLLFVVSLYFTYVFLDRRDVTSSLKLIFGALLLPAIVITPTYFNLSKFSNIDCSPIEGDYFNYYQYFINGLAVIWIVFLSFRRYRLAGKELKKQIMLFSFGMNFFLMLFLLAGVLAPYLYGLGIVNDYRIESMGMFGMPIFLGLLAYLIVRYQAFNVKIIATQALVVTLAMLIGSQLFFIRSQINFILTSITFLLSVLFGILLIRSVKNEIRRKEELQIVTDKLAAANVELKRLDQSKTEFISIASHQLRTPLTAIKGFVSLLLEGSYGAVPASIADVLDKIYTANDRIVHLVEDLLNISRMESGRLKYEYAEVNILEFLNELRDTFALVAKKKGLDLTFEVPAGALAPAWIDRQKAFEVVSNLIDNAIKYTSAGSVRVRAEGVPGFVRISVADTGVGIDPDMMPVLFQKFSRGKESGKMHVSGTGLGLYVGKSMIEAQGGHIGVTSEGRDKGSIFFVELPVKQG